MNNVINKTVVITGASSGIGEACVEQMLNAGWHVFATVRRMEDAAKLRSQNRAGLSPITLDVEDRDTIVAAAQQVSSQLEGRGDVGKMVGIALEGLKKDRLEIRPGPSNFLKLMSRLAPQFILNRLNRSVDAMLMRDARGRP